MAWSLESGILEWLSRQSEHLWHDSPAEVLFLNFGPFEIFKVRMACDFDLE